MARKKRTPGGRDTVSVEQAAGQAPKLPHERDESTDAMQGGPRERMRQAHDDLAAGRSDTSRGEVSDSTYRKLRK